MSVSSKKRNSSFSDRPTSSLAVSSSPTLIDTPSYACSLSEKRSMLASSISMKSPVSLGRRLHEGLSRILRPAHRSPNDVAAENSLISLPFDFKHEIHVNSELSGFPPAWLSLLEQLDVSEGERAMIQAQSLRPQTRSSLSGPAYISFRARDATNAGQLSPTPRRFKPTMTTILGKSDLLKSFGKSRVDRLERKGEDSGVSLPWNFQHDLHVDQNFVGLPHSWLALLPQLGYSKEEIARIRVGRPF